MIDKYQANQLDGDEIEINARVKEMCSELDLFISENIPVCRERALALTKLEECAMWATKGVAFNGTIKNLR